MVGAVLVVATVVAWVAGSARDDNERRLLQLQTDQVMSQIQSLATTQQSNVVTAASMAGLGSEEQKAFMATIRATADAGANSQQWATLHRTGSGFTVDHVVGPKPDKLSLLSEKLDSSALLRLKHAFEGQFVVVGFLGTGFDRKLALAAGPPGGGDVVAYTEYSLVQAASSSSGTSSGSNPLSEFDLALFVGSDTSPDGLVLATASLPITGEVATRTITVGEMPVTVQVRARSALSGSLASRTPAILGFLVLALGMLVALIMEANLRRRDHALQLVDDRDAALSARDVADAHRAKAESELLQAQRLDAVGRLAAGVAHDFNNLLAAIVSYADLLYDDVEDERSRDDITEIKAAAARGAALTRKLLQFGSKSPREVAELDVDGVIGAMDRLLHASIGEDVDLALELDGALPAVEMDPTELEQLVMNLVVNAGDAIEGPGHIIVRTDRVERAADGSEAGDAADLQPFVRLTVKDDGTGMTEDVAAQAFEPFFTTKQRGHGSGLGLAAVYGIAHRGGGHVAFDTQPGAGTTFEVLLPCDGSTPAPASAAPEAVPEAILGHGQSIVLVEDEEAVRVAASRMLRRWGYTVVEAANGDEALTVARDHDCDLLLTDVVMPGGLSGLDVADRLRAERPDLPVLFMSGYSDGVLERRGLRQDEELTVVAKPFSASELQLAVSTALGAAHREVVR